VPQIVVIADECREEWSWNPDRPAGDACWALGGDVALVNRSTRIELRLRAASPDPYQHNRSATPVQRDSKGRARCCVSWNYSC